MLCTHTLSAKVVFTYVSENLELQGELNPPPSCACISPKNCLMVALRKLAVFESRGALARALQGGKAIFRTLECLRWCLSKGQGRGGRLHDTGLLV